MKKRDPRRRHDRADTRIRHDGEDDVAAIGAELLEMRAPGSDRVTASMPQPSDFKSIDTNRATLRRTKAGREVVDLVSAWTGAGSSDDAEAARSSMLKGGYPLARRAMAEGPPTPRLFRGVYANSEESEAWIQSLDVGSEIDLLGASSFTTSRRHAQFFAGSITNVIIEIDEGDANGLPVEGISNSPGEREWMLTGHLEVTEAEREVSTDYEGSGFDVVSVRVKARVVRGRRKAKR